MWGGGDFMCFHWQEDGRKNVGVMVVLPLVSVDKAN